MHRPGGDKKTAATKFQKNSIETMANDKRRRRKKARTEDFSSDSSSDSDEEPKVPKVQATSTGQSDAHAHQVDQVDQDIAMDIDIPDADSDNEDQENKQFNHPKQLVAPELQKADEHDKKFHDYYMKLVTTEFADDLDKLRKANDFNEKSLGVLINTLKQGSHVFSPADADIVTKDL